MSGPDSYRANLKAEVLVNPILSQSVLTVLSLISVIPLGAGLYFLWHDKPSAWVPITIFFVLLVVVCVGWWRSQRSIDMGNSNPTQISDRHGNKIQTDTRILESENSISHLGVLLQSIGVREPLPEPDGFVDERGQSVPNSRDSAAERISDINEKLNEEAHRIREIATKSGSETVQTKSDLAVDPSVLQHNQIDPDADNG